MYLSLNGITIPNEGYVLASGIGADDSGLHCNTDKSGCCSVSDTPPGQWYRPNGNLVGSFTQEKANDPTQNLFSRNRGTGVVRLNRRNNPTERGRFRCEIPDINGDLINLYVNIGE